MDNGIIHVPQGSILTLNPGEAEHLINIFAKHGISENAVNLEQGIVSFPQGYVGYLCLPNRKIIIQPKHPGIDIRHIMRIYYFLYSTDDSDLDEPIYDIDYESSFDIVDLYMKELDKIIKKGLPVEYKNITNSSEFLRGKIDVVHSLQNLALRKREVFVCEYDELSHDVPINQVLFAAYSKAINSVKNSSSGLLKKYFSDVSIIEQIPRVTITTNTFYCKKAITLAYMILNELSVDNYGGNAYGQNLLINFDRIFEEFIKVVLTKYSDDHRFTYWDEEKPYAVANTANGEYVRSYLPDMLYGYQNLQYPTSASCILDMKNKVSKPFENADVFQMFFYAHQLNCNKVILCYPSSSDITNAVLKFDNDAFSIKKIHAAYINIGGNTASEFKQHIFAFIDNVKQLL